MIDHKIQKLSLPDAVRSEPASDPDILQMIKSGGTVIVETAMFRKIF
jgi:hypothetical protein